MFILVRNIDDKIFASANKQTLFTADKDYKYPATFETKYSIHGGEDVPVYANGPHSHLFTGVYEQNVIPHIIKYASCIGNGPKACIEPIH